MESYLIDTHTHLFSEEFNDDIAEVIARAEVAGVRRFVLPAIDSTTFDAMMTVAKQFPKACFPTIGLHPTSVKDSYEQELSFVKKQLIEHSFVAIGEIGIDCYWSTDHIEQQRYVFREQLKLAVEHTLPIIIHSRESLGEILAILSEFESGNLTGIFHSFSGTVADYQAIQRIGGFKLGIGGVLTFKNSTLSQLVKEVDISDIVLETDSPYLTPVPYRGKRNESSYLRLVAQKLAELKGLSLAELGYITTQNASAIFKI